MDAFYAACRALYDIAFPGENVTFTDQLFERYYPACLRTICENGAPVSMLFSIPYPLITASGEIDARYLYAVATHPAHRGKGHARALLLHEASEHAVFLRPMAPSLFDFYGRVGFAPFSPVETLCGNAARGFEREPQRLTPDAYLALRAQLAPVPCCVPARDFASLYWGGGGAVSMGEEAVALYEKAENKIFFKEWWGDVKYAPRLAAFLGGSHFELRRYAPAGEPFGMSVGLPFNAAFLAALD